MSFSVTISTPLWHLNRPSSVTSRRRCLHSSRCLPASGHSSRLGRSAPGCDMLSTVSWPAWPWSWLPLWSRPASRINSHSTCTRDRKANGSTLVACIWSQGLSLPGRWLGCSSARYCVAPERIPRQSRHRAQRRESDELLATDPFALLPRSGEEPMAECPMVTHNFCPQARGVSLLRLVAVNPPESRGAA